jgi:hypothetical protein
LAFGVAFSIFAGIASLVTYQLDKLMYSSAAPASFIQLGILNSAMPFIAYAIVSFVAAGIIWQGTKPKEEKLPETQTLLEEAQS